MPAALLASGDHAQPPPIIPTSAVSTQPIKALEFMQVPEHGRAISVKL
jgi:hypothetical protein